MSMHHFGRRLKALEARLPNPRSEAQVRVVTIHSKDEILSDEAIALAVKEAGLREDDVPLIVHVVDVAHGRGVPAKRPTSCNVIANEV